MKHSGAELITHLLKRQGIDTVFGIPGGANLPLYNALYKSNLRHILARHEQGAGFMAQGVARSTGKAAVCFATSGPGATNLLTAIADAKLDSIPLIAITGQVSTGLIGTDAFQEIDTYGMSMPVTKHNFLIRSAEELLEVIPEAFRIAVSGRPGPVLIDVPKDVQLQYIEFSSWPLPGSKIPPIKPAIPGIKEAVTMLSEAKRPVLYIGGGIIHAGASDLVVKLSHCNSVPAVCTLMGMGVFKSDDPYYMGMLGMHGARSTNEILNSCDLLLAFGTRFDDRATGKVNDFCPNARIIHADIDDSEFGKISKPHLTLHGDIGEILSMLLSHVEKRDRTVWMDQIAQIKEKYPSITITDDSFSPVNIIRSVAALVNSDAIICTDVGQHQMWVAQYYPFSSPRTLLSSGGLGTMGFGLPAAIGAALANPERKVILFTGDGSLLMNIQELATLADLNLDLTIILFNNGHLGLVRQQQELFYDKNYIASRFATNPDFRVIAEGFGITSYDLKDYCDSPVQILSRALAEQKACFVNVPIHYSHNVMPIVPPGAANIESIEG